MSLEHPPVCMYVCLARAAWSAWRPVDWSVFAVGVLNASLWDPEVVPWALESEYPAIREVRELEIVEMHPIKMYVILPKNSRGCNSDPGRVKGRGGWPGESWPGDQAGV
jgi:hypothetical protein